MKLSETSHHALQLSHHELVFLHRLTECTVTEKARENRSDKKVER